MYNKRLTLNYTDYILNPIRTIKSLLGHNIKIINHIPQSLILSNDTIPVDVTYSSSNSSSNSIYYINPNDLKPISINSTKYIHVSNPKFVITLPTLPTKTFPVRVFESLKSSVGFFGNIIDSPFTSLITPLKYANANVNEQTQQVDVTSPSFENLQSHVSIYTTGIKLFNSLSMIDNIIPIDSIPLELIDQYTTTAYIVDFNKLFSLNPTHCMIFFYADRQHPDICLFFPTTSYIISPEELQSVKIFCDKEREEFVKFEKLEK